MSDGTERMERDEIVIADAFAEFNERFDQRGIRARIYVHQGMTAIMVHRDGDADSTIDKALAEGPDIVGQIAAHITEERQLPDDWLNRIATETPTVPAKLEFTIRERLLRRVLETAVGLAERCVAVARQPDASKLKKRCALVGIKSAPSIHACGRFTPTRSV